MPNSTRPARRRVLLATIALAISATAVGAEEMRPLFDRVPTAALSPSELAPAQHGIGQAIEATAAQSLDGNGVVLFDRPVQRGTLVVVRDPHCPISVRYGPRIASLGADYARQGFDVVFIYPSANLEVHERQRDMAALAVPGFYVGRGSFTLADRLGVRSTGDVFVLDRDNRLRYRGAVDDQFGIGYTREFPTRHYLRDALDAVGEGRQVSISATAAPGCYIDPDIGDDETMFPLPAGQLAS